MTNTYPQATACLACTSYLLQAWQEILRNVGPVKCSDVRKHLSSLCVRGLLSHARAMASTGSLSTWEGENYSLSQSA